MHKAYNETSLILNFCLFLHIFPNVTKVAFSLFFPIFKPNKDGQVLEELTDLKSLPKWTFSKKILNLGIGKWTVTSFAFIKV